MTVTDHISVGGSANSPKARPPESPFRERVVIRPTVFTHTDANLLLRNCVRALQRVGSESSLVAEIRAGLVARAERLGPAIAPEVMLAVSVLCDLRAQGWCMQACAYEIVAS